MALPRSPIGRLAFPGSNRKFVCGNRLWESGFEEASGETIVAVELHVIEEGGDSVPTGSGGGFGALHVSAGGEHDVAVTHGLADENDFELEQSSHGERPGAEEVDARRADVPGNQSDWKFRGDGCPQRARSDAKAEASPGWARGWESFAERPRAWAEPSLHCLRRFPARAALTLRDSSQSSRPQEIPQPWCWVRSKWPDSFF